MMRNRRTSQRTLSNRLLFTLSLLLLLLTGGAAAIQSQKSASQLSFAELSALLSERGGYFHSDNLVSNETCYQHVLEKLGELKLQGGVYIGVGPEQNFTYIAKLRPARAFILDIRRDNAVQHLMYKAIFVMASSRAEFLSLLTCKPTRKEAERLKAPNASINDLVIYFDQTNSSELLFNRNLQEIREQILKKFKFPLTEDEQESLERIYRSFYQTGLDTRYETAGYSRRFPALRDLLVERDLSGKQQGFLATEENFQFVKKMHEKDLIVPVTGDFAGPKALRAIGDYTRSLGERVTAFYTSNVESYLMRNGSFSAFAENVKTLPIDNGSLFIRNFSGFRYQHPESVPGHSSTTLLQKIANFVKLYDEGRYQDYTSLGLLDYISTKKGEK